MTDYLAVLASAALAETDRPLRPVRPPVFGQQPSATPAEEAAPMPAEGPEEHRPLVAPAPPGPGTLGRPSGERITPEVRPQNTYQIRPVASDADSAHRGERRPPARPDTDVGERRHVFSALPSGPAPAGGSAPAPDRPAEHAGAASVVSPAANGPARVGRERLIEVAAERRGAAQPVAPVAASVPPPREQPPRVVHVSIGRIEIRAVQPPAPPPPSVPANPGPPRFSLDDYLQGREHSRRR